MKEYLMNEMKFILHSWKM